MEQLTWTGNLAFLNPVFLTTCAVLLIAIAAQIALSLVPSSGTRTGPMTLAITRGPGDYAGLVVKWSFSFLVLVTLAYLVGGIAMPSLEAKGILGGISTRFLPIWIGMAVVFALSVTFKRR